MPVAAYAVEAPAPAPKPAPAPAPAADAAQPTVKTATPLKPAISPVGGGIRKPLVGGALKPGLKLPAKPSLAPGLKLPAKPSLAPGLKLPPKPGVTPAAKPAAPAAGDDVADLEPVEMTPVE